MYRNGLLHGECKSWYEDNPENIWMTYSYKYGNPEGVYIKYHKNRTPMSKAFYKDGKLQGEYYQWFDDGSIQEMSIFKDNVCVKYLRKY